MLDTISDWCKKISVYDEFVIKHLVKDKIMEITKNFSHE